jgi:FkbM family methyltransferase
MSFWNFLSLFFYSVRNPLITQFIRLTPNYKGKIFFYNREVKKFFSIYSRGNIDSIVSDQIYTKHEYRIRFRSEDAANEYSRIIDSGAIPLILDCGSNIGLSTKFFAERYPQALVIAIEPDTENIEIAKLNCRNLDNVEFIQGAIGSEIGFVKIANPQSDPFAFQTKRVLSDSSLRIFTVDQILKSHESYTPFLVKIDIEGFEKDLFKTNTSWIAAFYVMIIELHDWLFPSESNSGSFLNAISKQDRDFVYIGENIFSMKNS